MLGGSVYGLDFPPSQYDQDWTAITNVTSTTYIAGTPEVAVSVTAPSSGRVAVSVGCGVRDDTAGGDRASVSYRIFQDSVNGALFEDTDVDRGIQSCGITQAQQFQYHGNVDIVEGLTPGKSYYFQVTHLAFLGAGTIDIASRNILVFPIP
jgi:hypothetical protein